MQQKTNNDNVVYDLLGVGIGPFNLGLAALSEPLNEMSTIFLEQSHAFNWHPGLLLDNATLQVPYLADMVTFADPTSRYTFLNYLKEHNRLYKFYFYESFFVLRPEYNHYCQWVSSQLNNVRFKTKVVDIAIDENRGLKPVYKVKIMDILTNKLDTIYAKHISLGVGTSAHIPANLVFPDSQYIFHAANFLVNQSHLDDAKTVCVVGSGQSAAEIVLELLNQQGAFDREIIWVTRSDGFFPMEYSKLGLEHFSPDYMDLFYRLNQDTKNDLIANQDMMYKGISKKTIADIFDLLYQQTIANKPQPLTMISNVSLNSIEAVSDMQTRFSLNLYNNLTDSGFKLKSDAVILATGYKSSDMQLLAPLDDLLKKDTMQGYALNRDFSIQSMGNNPGKIFMQNNSMFSHGVGSPDLGLGCYRNSVIINTILGYDFYKIQTRNVFQDFGKFDMGNK